jgi:hypothetical protein
MATEVRASLIVAALLSAACTYTKTVRPDEPLSQDGSYIYGRFRIETPWARGEVFAKEYQTMGFVIDCDDQYRSRYTIRFANSRDVQLIRVRPSRCALVAMVFTNADGIIKSFKPAPEAWRHYFDVRGGTAYYLGDYVGVASVRHGYTTEWNWSLTSADDNYEITTGQLKRTYREIAAMPTEKRQLVPPDRQTEKRAVLPGPPMTPERIAHVASFISRRYTDPAACKAACASGQCLAYRDGGAVVMTCVAPCEADEDCPAGLACNCAEASDDCRPIASTPTDPMTGLCLAPPAAPVTP